jgi:phosphodiesterase/alkaline phosphatase D-like protein
MAGDFIYEYDTDAAAPAGRNVYPPKEIVTLQDYRLRYQTYHTDPELVRMRAALPLISEYYCTAFVFNA